MSNFNVLSDNHEVEIFVQEDSDSICIVPTDDLIMELRWSDKHGRVVCVVRVKPIIE